MSPAKTVDEMAIATATIGYFLAEFSFVTDRLLKITLHALLEADAPAWGHPHSSDRRPATPGLPGSGHRRPFSHNERTTTGHIPRIIIWWRRKSFLDPRKLDPIQRRSYLKLNQFP